MEVAASSADIIVGILGVELHRYLSIELLPPLVK
jgi:hypothetical protein